MKKALKVDFGAITVANIEQLKRLNVAAFPLQYNENFYKEILKHNHPELNKVAYWNGVVVGAVCTRLEDTDNGHQRLYIMTLAVLAAYRGRAVGSQLLQSILDFCEEHRIVAEIALHVQVSNQGAIDFYMKRFDFTLGERVDNYYRRIDPPHCYRLFKKLLEDDQESAWEDGSVSSSKKKCSGDQMSDAEPEQSNKNKNAM